MHILSTKDISTILLNLTQPQLETLTTALFSALHTFSSPNPNTSTARIFQPLRTSLTTSTGNTTLTMPCSNTENTSVKTVTVPSQGPIQGSITLYTATGEPIGLLNAAEVTAFRTALAVILPLSRSKWASSMTTTTSNKSHYYNLVVFGSGRQAEWHIRLILRYANIKSITAVNRSSARARSLTNTLAQDIKKDYAHITFGTLIQEANQNYEHELKKVLEESDIICCTTPSTTPLFSYDYLTTATSSPRKQRFISCIGSYKPNMQEIDSETLLSGAGGNIIVDSIEACLEEAGEIIKADVSSDSLVEIGSLYESGSRNGGGKDKGPGSGASLLVPESGNVVFKCVGMSVMDLAVSKALLDMSREAGVGLELTDF